MRNASNEYAFVTKKARVEENPRTPDPVAAPGQVAPPSPGAPAPIEETAAATTVVVKKVVRRIRRVMRPKAAPTSARGAKAGATARPQRLDPVSMKVVELRAELKRRGLKAAGLKAVLVDRLLEAMENDDDDDSDEEDDVVELEEVDEEYDEEVEVEAPIGASEAASAAHTSSPGRKSRDEIVRESIDEFSLSQRSNQDESLSLSQSSDTSQTGASKKRPRPTAFVPDSAVISEDEEDTETTQREDSQAPEVSSAEPVSAPEQRPTAAAAKKPASKWTFAAGASRRGVLNNDDQGSRVPAAEHSTGSIAGETDTAGAALNSRSKDVVEAEEDASQLLDANHKSSRATIGGESLAERKASLKVSFAPKNGDTIVPELHVDSARSGASISQSSSSEDPITRLRSISLPQVSVSSAADPVTPNGQGTTDELLVARSEPGPGAPDETDEERQKREQQLTIEREAQRLRIAAKLSAKKRFEEAMLSSSFWAKRDRLKSQQQQPESAADQPANDGFAEELAASALNVAIKAEPEAEAATVNPPFVAASPSSDPSHAVQTSLKPEPPARSKSVKIPFSSSNRRFSDPSRRLSASRRRESASSRRDSASSRRDSTSSRRNSLTRRRDSGSSTLSSASTKSSNGSQKTDASAAAGNRKPTNLVSGLHSFTSLLEKENANTSASARSAPVVNALKLAEKTRLMEQKKNLEKMKRKEALMKKYEEQRKLDDDKKKKAIGIKEKAERDAKLKREQDKMNEKKQREIELAKRRHQKLQEMRAGLEKKRALLAAEKQAGAAKLAAQAAAAASTVASSSSNRRTSTSSASTQAPRPAVAVQAPKSSTVSQVPAKPSQAANGAGASKPAKPSASMQVPKATSSHTASAAAKAPPPAKDAAPHPKERPTDTSTYDMSDNGESSEGDGDDSDDEDKHNKKNIPRWARKENLERILRVQFGPNASDPSPAIFPDFVDTCDLEAIFEPTDVRKKKRFQKRSSSGNWFGDRPTAREKAVYKRDMGYLR